MRIVSLACSNTEIVAALGCGHLLVGVDSHSDHPPEVLDPLPRVGPDLEIDIQAVAELEPDLVLASLTVPGHEKVVEGLERAGLPHMAPEPRSLQDVYANVREIAEALGVPERGRELAARMEQGLGPGSRSGGPAADGDTGAGRAGELPSGPNLLVQWWPKPTIAPGALSWTTDVMHAAGARNPLEAEEVKSRPIADEEVEAMAPDAIVLSWCGVDPAKYRPDVIYRKETWRDVPAVREGRVFCVPEAYLGRPGPRLLDGLREIRRIVEELTPAPPPSARTP